MSDMMLLGVLRMPYEVAMSNELSRLQFHQRAQSAADRIEADADRIAELERQVAVLVDALEYAIPYLKACVPNPRNGVNADCSMDVNCVDRAIAALAQAKKEGS